METVLVKSAYRVMNILDLVGSKPQGITHGEISKSLGIPKGSVSKLLSTLLEQDYLCLDGAGKYKLGPQLLALAGRYLSSLDLIEVGRPVLEDLVAATNESTELDILKGDRVMVVALAHCDRHMVRAISIGDTVPIHATAAGKAMLAHLPNRERERYLAQAKLRPVTSRTITDTEVLRCQLEQIRSGAIAYNHEELYEDIVGMAAPVFGADGSVVASLVLVVPSVRFTEEKKLLFDQALRAGAAELSYRLGYANPQEAGSRM